MDLIENLTHHIHSYMACMTMVSGMAGKALGHQEKDMATLDYKNIDSLCTDSKYHNIHLVGYSNAVN